MPWSRAPLCRGSDRIQAWLTLLLVVLMLIIAPWVARWTASTTYLAEVRANAWETEHYRRVTAVLTQDASGRSRADGGAAVSDVAVPDAAEVSAPVRWTGPDGAVRSEMVSVAVGARAGSMVTVWLDERGVVALPPGRRNPALDASVTATLAALAVITFLGSLRRIVVWRLDRRRLRSWEAEWLIVGPRWSRR